MDNSSQIDSIILEKVNKYIIDNYVEDIEDNGDLYTVIDEKDVSNLVINYSTFEKPFGLKNIKEKIDDTWQENVFYLIDKKNYSDPEVYKRASISKQTFSKIRYDVFYKPNKDTAIQICIGLKLNLEETLDLMDKAGYTLSKSIKRDLVVRCFIEEKIYKINDINAVLDEMNLKLFSIN